MMPVRRLRWARSVASRAEGSVGDAAEEARLMQGGRKAVPTLALMADQSARPESKEAMLVVGRAAMAVAKAVVACLVGGLAVVPA